MSLDELTGTKKAERTRGGKAIKPAQYAVILDYLLGLDPADGLVKAVAAGDPLALAALLHNDLQAPAIDLRPDLGVLLERGESEGALRGIVSGSGPTCAFLCESGDHARDLAGALGRLGHDVVLVTNGAVAGAHLVENLHG